MLRSQASWTPILPADPALAAGKGRRLDALYAGAVFHLSATPASRALTGWVRGLVEEALGDDAETAHARLDGAQLFDRVTAVRRRIAASAEWPGLVAALLAEVGLDPAEHYGDHPRLRAAVPFGHRLPAARGAYTVHRDTWYANPRAQVNWWYGLYDIPAARSFTFFPAFFARPIANSSNTFDLERWRQSGGFQAQQRAVPTVYPEPTEPLDGAARTGFAVAAGEGIAFAAAHLHGTNPNETGRIRFSIDFRTTHAADHAAGRGAPDPDNAARGDVLAEYVRLPG